VAANRQNFMKQQLLQNRCCFNHVSTKTSNEIIC